MKKPIKEYSIYILVLFLQLLFFSGKTCAQDVVIRFQVFDEQTNHSIRNAVVDVKTIPGKRIAGGFVGLSENVKITLTPEQLKMGNLRVVAAASDYEEKWSDIPPELLTTGGEERYYTVYLKKKKSSVLKTYGPFDVGLTDWVETGIKIKSGNHIKIVASGEMKSIKNTIVTQFGPDGETMRGWWELKAKIGHQIIMVGKSLELTVRTEGKLSLGVPRVKTFFEEDAKSISGSFKVYVYSKDSLKGPGADPAYPEKLVKAKHHLEYLNQVYKGDKILLERGNDELIGQQVKSIIFLYNLPSKNNKKILDQGIDLIKLRFYRIFNNGGPLNPDEKAKFDIFIFGVITELESIIQNQEL